MALSKEGASHKSQIGECFFVCGICLYNFQNPKALPCLHTFCCECIRQWSSKIHIAKSSGGLLACPSCNKQTQMPPEGVDGLPYNFYIPLLKEGTDQNTLCCMSCANSCADSSEIQGRCKECGWLCQRCVVSHKSLKALSTHSVLELQKLRIGKHGKTKPAVTEVKHSANRRVTKKTRFGSWKVEKQFGNFRQARGVAVAPNGDIAVTEFTGDGKVHVFTRDGKPRFTLDTTKALSPSQASKPYGIAIDSQGRFYVTDTSPFVHVFSKKGNHLFLINVIDDDDASCRGVAIHGKMLFIGYREPSCMRGETYLDYVSIHETDGTLKSRFKTSNFPRYMTVSSDAIVVSSGEEFDDIEAYDNDGKSLKLISLDNESCLFKGVCFFGNSEEDLLVADSVKSKCCIHRFSTSGRYKGVVAKNLSAENIFGLTTTTATQDGKERLFIVSKTNVIVCRWIEAD